MDAKNDLGEKMMTNQISITKPFFDEKELEYLHSVLESGWVTQGPMTQRFEEEFKTVHDCKFAVAVSSCTAALHIAMLTLDIHEGDEVIVPAYTWITSASCVEYVGANVRFCDVEKETMNIDTKKLVEVITPKTKAIIVVHLFGNPAKMDDIMEIARRYGLYVVEDCACAIGTVYKNQKVGGIGDIGCFSFHPRKVITTGEGGICSVNNEKLYYKMLQLRNHGASVVKKGGDFGKPYYMGVYDELGYNLRLSDIQAAVGVAQFQKLKMLLDDRERCAQYYLKRLAEVDDLILPVAPQRGRHTYQSFVVLLKSGDREKRNYIMENFLKEKIQSRPGTIAISRTEYNKNKYRIQDGEYPIAEFCEDASITLPIYPYMSSEDQDRIINIFIKSL